MSRGPVAVERRPAMVGPYRVIRLIGGGGAGHVYLCRAVDGNRVAVKVAGPAATVADLRREAAACAAVSHPNIVRTVGSGWDGPTSYLALEHIVGLTFAQLIRATGPLPARMAAEYGLCVAKGLAHLHAASWVHRDVKPTNVMRTLTGEVKLIDLGAACRMDDRGCPPIAWGTVPYLAPELVRRPDLADPRSDVYGLGAVLFHMLTGRPPGPPGTDAGLLLWALTADARPVPRLGRQVPGGLAVIVRCMLAADPAQRHPSAVAVAEALTTWLRDDNSSLR